MRSTPSQCLSLLVLLACLVLPACTPHRAAPEHAASDPALPENKKELRIGVLRHAPPMSYADSHGEMTGFAVDLARNVVQKIAGNKARAIVVPLDANERIPALRSGKVDMLFANMVVTPELAGQVRFSNPYRISRLGVLSPAGRRISALVQLRGKRLAVPMQTAAESYFQKMQAALLRTATNGEAFAALRNGQADAVAQDSLSLVAWAAANSGYVLGIPALGNPELIAPAVRHNDTPLATAINRALATIEAEDFFLTAYNRHMPGYARLGLTPDMIFPVFSALP